MQDTGGTWVFVLDENSGFAYKRDIITGRRNNQFLEIQGGLQEGETVITSSYNRMLDMERIQLQ